MSVKGQMGTAKFWVGGREPVMNQPSINMPSWGSKVILVAI